PGLGYRFICDLQDENVRIPSLVLESETISKITIHEERTSDHAIDAAKPVELTTDGNVAEHGASKGIVPYQSTNTYRRTFNIRSALLVGGVVILAAITILVVRRLQRTAVAAPRFANFKVTPVTNTGRLGTVAISADGKLFAFNQKGGGEHSSLNALYLGQVNGEKTVELIAPAEVFYRHLEYANDGSAIF